MAKISVIIPIFNSEDYIRSLNDSFQRQTFKDFELILVDNASTDNSVSILDELADSYGNIIVIHEKEKHGPGHGRNLGLDRAFESDSDYVAHIDADDYVSPFYLEKLYNAMVETNSDVAWCGFFRSGCRNASFDGESISGEPQVYTDIESLWCEKEGCGLVWAKLFKKELFRNERFPKDGPDDLRLMYKIFFKARSIAVIPDRLYCYYKNPQSFTQKDFGFDKHKQYIDGLYEQLLFFHDKKFKKAYQKVLDYYFFYYFDVTMGKAGERAQDIIAENKSRIVFIFDSHVDMVDKQVIKNIYNKSLSAAKKSYKKRCLSFFRHDVASVKKQNGRFYALL